MFYSLVELDLFALLEGPILVRQFVGASCDCLLSQWQAIKIGPDRYLRYVVGNNQGPTEDRVASWEKVGGGGVRAYDPTLLKMLRIGRLL